MILIIFYDQSCQHYIQQSNSDLLIFYLHFNTFLQYDGIIFPISLGDITK